MMEVRRGMDPDMPDSMLVEAARCGDRAAYGALAARYRGAMVRTASAVAGAGEAEDVVQEVLLRAHAGLGGLRDPSAVGPWLLTAVRRAVPRPSADASILRTSPNRPAAGPSPPSR
jgi:RNA polymerase sigma-70 factor (ECF subfamily)